MVRLSSGAMAMTASFASHRIKDEPGADHGGTSRSNHNQGARHRDAIARSKSI